MRCIMISISSDVGVQSSTLAHCERTEARFWRVCCFWAIAALLDLVRGPCSLMTWLEALRYEEIGRLRLNMLAEDVAAVDSEHVEKDEKIECDRAIVTASCSLGELKSEKEADDSILILEVMDAIDGMLRIAGASIGSGSFTASSDLICALVVSFGKGSASVAAYTFRAHVPTIGTSQANSRALARASSGDNPRMAAARPSASPLGDRRCKQACAAS